LRRSRLTPRLPPSALPVVGAVEVLVEAGGIECLPPSALPVVGVVEAGWMWAVGLVAVGAVPGGAR
jgi:hypothetical protein